MDVTEGLDAFLMLRSNVGVTTGVKRSQSTEPEGAPHSKKGVALNNYVNCSLYFIILLFVAMVVREVEHKTYPELAEKTASSTFLDSCLSGNQQLEEIGVCCELCLCMSGTQQKIF